MNFHPHHRVPFDDDGEDRQVRRLVGDLRRQLIVADDRAERLEHEVAHLRNELARARRCRWWRR